MRLDQYLASGTGLSRKGAKRAITGKRIQVNGQLCRSTSANINTGDSVLLDGEPVTLPGELYLMLHKPAGVISATTDSSQPTALDLLPPELARQLHIAGRLDKDTTGLLLLTSDGQWSHRVTSPRRDCPKTYRVQLAEPLTAEARQALEQGIQLNGEDTATRPAQVLACSEQEIELTISKGRYHQVKRMLAAVGNHVTALHRQRIGAIELDAGLAPGQFRELTRSEIDSV